MEMPVKPPNLRIESTVHQLFIRAINKNVIICPLRKSLFMIEEFEKQKRKQIALRKAIMDYAIGGLITCVGIFFMIRDRLTLQFNENFPPNDIDKIFGFICILYGVWRMYRGYKKNYFK